MKTADIKNKKKRRSLFAKFLRGEQGWTFVETIIVIMIIVLLSGTVVIAAIKQVEKAKIAKARSTIDAYMSALQLYYGDCLAFPTEEQGLEALVKKPTAEPVPEEWDGPYLSKTEIEPDPWKNEYIYNVPGPNGLDYSIISWGADGLQGGSGKDEDIVSW